MLNRLAMTLAAVLGAFCGVRLPAQQDPQLPAAVETTVASLEQRLLECLVDLDDVGALRQRLDLYRRALGTRAEASVIAFLLDALRDCPPDEKPSLEGARVTELLDRIGFHRRRGHPERMLPPLLVLKELLSDDARVLYALGEAYGVQSAAFDAGKAGAAFAGLYEQLLAEPARPKTPRAQARELVRFLPELGGSTDRTAWLRDRVLGFCETLRDNQPIGLWKLRDPRLEELQEDLGVVLPRGFQRELVDVLEQMRAIHPDDPAACYMLAQVHASMGPEWNPERSVELFREFLDLTMEERFQKTADGDPLMSRDDVVKRLLGMQLADTEDQLRALRIVAKETVIDLTRPKGRPQPKLFFPELAKLQRTTMDLQKVVARENDNLRRSQEKIDKVRAELEAAKDDYERWKRESSGRRRVFVDPQPFVDAINSRKELLPRLEKQQALLEERVAPQQAWLTACEARLQQFAR